MRKYLSLVVVLLGFSLALAACGADTGPSTDIKVTMTDFMFDPTQFTVPAGQEIKFQAINNGTVEHEFVIFKLGTDAGDKFGPEDEENIYWKMKAQPGETVNETFTAPTEPGSYFVTCGIAGHLEAGMQARLIVVE